jgi:hypothetical protein
MTLLTALQWVQRQCSLPVTTSIVGDAQESQQLLFALAQEEAEELAARHEWPRLRGAHTFSASASQLQPAGLPADFDRMIPLTFWNRTRDLRIDGPIGAQKWQELQAVSVGVSALSPYWILRADGLHVLPAPQAGDAMAYDYVIDTPVQSSGGTPQNNFEADTDVFLLGDDLLKRGVRWRYLAQKGLDYAEHMKSYERWVQNRINARTGAGDADLAVRRDVLPLATIREGDW